MRKKKFKKKVKFSFKRMLAYVSTYIACTFGVASIVVLSNSNSYSANSPILFEEEAPTTLGLIVNNLMTLQDLSLNIDLSIQKGEQTVSANLFGDVVIYSGFSNVELDLTGNLNLDENNIQGNVIYKDGKVYISSNNKTYSFETSSIVDSLKVVLALAGAGDMSEAMGAFDMSLINTLEEKITEEVLDNGVKLLFAVTDDLSLEIITDSKYNLKSVSLTDYHYGEYEINANISLPTTNSGLVINAPSESENITPAFNLLNGAIKALEKDGVNFEFKYKDINLDGTFNIKEQALRFNANVLGNDASVYYRDNCLYLDAPILKLKSQVSDIYSAVKPYINIDENVLTNILGVLGSLNTNELIKNISFEEINETNGYIFLDLNDYKFMFDLSDGLIKNVQVLFDDEIFTLDLSYDDVKVEVPNYDYINVFDLAELVEPIKNIVSSNGLSSNISLDLGEINLEAALNVTYDPFKLQLSGELFGVSYVVTYLDNYAYIEFNETKIKLHKNSFSEIVEFIKQHTNVDEKVENADIKDVVETLNSVTDYLTLVIDNSFNFAFADYLVSLNINEENLLDICLQIDGVKANISLDSLTPKFTNLTDDFEEIAVTKDGLNELVKNIEKTDYNLDLEIMAGSQIFNMNFAINFSDGLLVNASANIFGFDVKIVLQENILYVDVDGIKVKGTLSELSVIIETLISKLNTKSTATLGEVNLPNEIKFDLTKVNYKNGKLYIDLSELISDAKLEISLKNYDVKDVVFESKDFSVKVTNNEITELNKAVELQEKELKQYQCEVSDLANLLTYVENSMQNGGAMISSYLYLGEKQLRIDTRVNWKDDFNGYIGLTYNNETYKVHFINETIYLTAYNLKLKFDVARIDEFKTVLASLLGKELTIDTSEITKTFENIDVQNITQFVKNIKSGDNFVSVALDGGLQFVIYNKEDVISSLHVSADDFVMINNIRYFNNVVLPSINENSYIDATDILNVVENTKQLLFGKFVLTATLNIDGKNLSHDLYIDNTNGLKVYTDLTIKDKLVSVYYENNALYIAIDDYKIMVEINDISDIVSWAKKLFNLDLSYVNNMNFDVDEQSITDIISYIITNVAITENNLTLSYEEYKFDINYDIYVNNIVLTSGNNSVSLNIVENKNISLPNLPLAEYRDWTVTAEVVEKILTQVSATMFDFDVEVSFGGNKYDANIKVDVTNNVYQLTTNIGGYELVINVDGEVVYINFGGLRLKDNFTGLMSSVEELLRIFNVDMSQMNDIPSEMPKFDLIQILNSLEIDSIGEGVGYIKLSIEDILGLKDKLGICDNVANITLWHNDKQLEKLDITNEKISLSATLISNTVDIVLSDEQKTLYVTEVSELITYVERLYSSYKNVVTEDGYAISGKISVRYSQLCIEGNLSLNVVNGKIYAHINSDAFGLSTNIYLADKNIYVNIAGLKLALTLSENDINDIINWVNTNFNQNISFEYSDEMLDVKMPDLNNVKFELSQDVFGVNLTEYLMAGSLNTRFENALVSLMFEGDILNTIDLATNVLDKNTVVYEEGYKEHAFDFENSESQMKNLVLRLNDLGFGADASTEVWGFENNVLTTISGESLDTFNDYSNVLDMIEWVLNYYKEGKFNLDANLTLKENVNGSTRNVLKLENGKVYSSLQLDENMNPLDGMFYAGGDLIEYHYDDNNDSSTRHSISAYYDNDAFYGSYTHDNKVFNGNETTGQNEKYLRVKIGKDSIREILSIILHVLAIDLGTVGETLSIPECNLNVDNLQNMLGIKKNNSGEIISDIDKILSSVESIIGLVNNINLSVNDNVSVFSVGLNIGNEVMTIKIGFDGQKLSYIKGENIAVNDNQTLDMNLGVSENTAVPSYDTNAEHIDLTNASSLLKSFINTSALNDYHIKGQIALSVLDIKAAKLDVDVKVKLVNNKPVIAIEIDNYPLIGGVNGSNTNGVGATGLIIDQRHRKVTIYIKDGIAYLRTIDEKWGAYKEYERATKIDVSTLFNQLEYYMQYLLGFTDLVQGEINSAIEAGRNRQYPINICNIINSFNFENGWYNIAVNLSELAYSNDIGTMVINLTTINNASTNNLDYLYKLGLNVDMLDSLIKLETDNSSEDILKLVDIGLTQDFTSIENYMNNFTYGKEIEVERKGSDSLAETNSSSGSVTFVMNNGSADVTTSGNVGQNISFPASTYVYDDGTVKRVYTLEGWYNDAELTTLFNKTTYSRFNSYTVYAKWNLFSEKYYYYYTLNYNNGTSATSHKALEGTYIYVDILDDYVVDNGVTKTTYYFKGWYLDSNYTTKFTYVTMPNHSMNLYAKWESVTEYYRTITFANLLGNNVDNIVSLEDDKITLPTNIPNTRIKSGDVTTIYGFEGWFTDIECTQEYSTNSMPDSNITLYAGWKIVEQYTEKLLTIIDNGVSKFNGYVRVGSAMTFSNVKVDNYTLWYLDQAFTQPYTCGFDVMPNANVTLYVCNAYTLTINSKYGNVYTNSTRIVYQGSAIEMPSQPSTYVVDNYGVDKTTYQFNGYTNSTSVMPNSDLILTANWVEIDKKNYYTITFDVLTGASQINAGFTNKIKFYNNGVETSQKSYTYLQGDNIDLSQFTAKWEYDTWFFGTIWYHYPFQGWATTDGGSRVYNHPVTGNATLYCRWGDLKTGKA